jgi:hypothetical protein
LCAKLRPPHLVCTRSHGRERVHERHARIPARPLRRFMPQQIHSLPQYVVWAVGIRVSKLKTFPCRRHLARRRVHCRPRRPGRFGHGSSSQQTCRRLPPLLRGCNILASDSGLFLPLRGGVSENRSISMEAWNRVIPAAASSITTLQQSPFISSSPSRAAAASSLVPPPARHFPTLLEGIEKRMVTRQRCHIALKCVETRCAFHFMEGAAQLYVCTGDVVLDYCSAPIKMNEPSLPAPTKHRMSGKGGDVSHFRSSVPDRLRAA